MNTAIFRPTLFSRPFGHPVGCAPARKQVHEFDLQNEDFKVTLTNHASATANYYHCYSYYPYFPTLVSGPA